MKTLIGTLASIAIGFVVLPAGKAAAAEVTAEQRAAYLACYRRVLMAPEFALMASARLYRIRDGRLARAVFRACLEEIRPYGMDLLEAALRAPDKTGGGTPRPEGWLFAILEAGLRQRVADDLAEAAPRVKPFADAEAGKAAVAPEQ